MKQIELNFELTRSTFSLQLELQLPGQGVSALFGPSGSGKTTLLRCLAGLERAQGQVKVLDELWQNQHYFKPVHQRALAYVFQEPSLFPHLSVQQNLLYGYQRTPPAQRQLSLEQVVDWLGLAPLLTRKNPGQLSGGEQQRVAIGRALLSSPRLLLMDEPLSALDAASKQEIFPYLERLHQELALPVIYVSHALDEVCRLADFLVLLQQGRVLASGPLTETLLRLDLPLAHYADSSSILCATLLAQHTDYHLSELSVEGDVLWLNQINVALGSSVRVRILARDVSLCLHRVEDSSISNILAVQIVEICDEGPDKVNVKLQLGQQQLISRITRRSREQLGLTIGLSIFAQIKTVALML